MDAEDLEPLSKKAKPRDLTILSIEDLEEYIDILQAEIKRSEIAISAKKRARDGAESIFN